MNGNQCFFAKKLSRVSNSFFSLIFTFHHFWQEVMFTAQQGIFINTKIHIFQRNKHKKRFISGMVSGKNFEQKNKLS